MGAAKRYQAQQKQFADKARRMQELQANYREMSSGPRHQPQHQYSSRYAAYLASEHWQQFRLNLLASEGGRCEDCRRTGLRVQVHHLHYNSVGHEQRQDVLVLCRDCHAKRHNLSSSSAEHLVRRIPPAPQREQAKPVKFRANSRVSLKEMKSKTPWGGR